MGWSLLKKKIIKGKLGFLKEIEKSSEEKWARKKMQQKENKST